MEKERISLRQAKNTKVILTKAKEKDMEHITLQMAISTKANGKTIYKTEKANTHQQMD
jgi:hypothetical protein